jgi:hypothetical protein
MCRIAALLPPDRRGAYAEHPRLQELLAGDGSPPGVRTTHHSTTWSDVRGL